MRHTWLNKATIALCIGLLLITSYNIAYVLFAQWAALEGEVVAALFFSASAFIYALVLSCENVKKDPLSELLGFHRDLIGACALSVISGGGLLYYIVAYGVVIINRDVAMISALLWFVSYASLPWITKSIVLNQQYDVQLKRIAYCVLVVFLNVLLVVYGTQALVATTTVYVYYFALVSLFCGVYMAGFYAVLLYGLKKKGG